MSGSYSYVNNNPIRYRDPSGKFVPLIVALGYVLTAYGIAQTAVDTYDFINTDIKYRNVFTPQEKIDSATTLALDLTTSGLSGVAEKLGYEGLGKALDVVSTGSGILDVLKGVSEESSTFRRREQTVQVSVSGSDTLRSPALSSGASYLPVSNSQRTPVQKAYQWGGSLTSAQSVALSNLSSAFTPTNAAQAAAVQSVVSAFTKG